MKIVKIEKQVIEIAYVTTDEEMYNFYRRQGGSWEILMGESWESMYLKDDELEHLFLEQIYS
jgi:hypothetical protein